MSPASAPAAPGRLGMPIDVQALRSYLIALDGWLEARRGELEVLDEAVRASKHCDELTPDVALGLQLWQSIQTRFRQLLQVWDGGRVLIQEREQLASMIWGRVDDAWGALATSGMSLPEACRMSDALTGQLRSRLQLDPAGTQAVGRLRDLRASMERLRDQVALEPPQTLPGAKARLGQLEDRLTVISDKAGRGGDIGGLLGPLEADAATFERDLIVGGVLRRQQAARSADQARPATGQASPTGDRAELAARMRADLIVRGQQLQELVDRLAPSIPEPPKYAVPDVTALGPVPAEAGELDAYLTRLLRVGQAMDRIDHAYAQAVRGHPDDLLARMRGLTDELAALNPPPAEAIDALRQACSHYLDWRSQQGGEPGQVNS